MATKVLDSRDNHDRGSLNAGGGAARFAESAAKVAALAADCAVSVDDEARFPDEAIGAARDQRLLGIMVPHELGGAGAALHEVADVCYQLGRGCASTGMIYAMHQSIVACLVRHGRSSPWHEALLGRVAAEQLLLASSTTEGNRGGDVRVSAAPITYDGERIALERDATVISYGAEADAIATTARRNADAAATDQVLAVFLKDDYTLQPRVAWETLGMRGTCSAGFALTASGGADQLCPQPYSAIHPETMAPVSHLLWSATWCGIAADAVERARAFTRAAARKAGGQLPPAAGHLAKADGSLTALRSLVAAGIQRFERSEHDARTLASVDFQTGVNLLKVEASEMAVATVMTAMRATGLAGYRNDGEFSLGRHLRDVLSAPIMINNERILANVGKGALLGRAPAALVD